MDRQIQSALGVITSNSGNNSAGSTNNANVSGTKEENDLERRLVGALRSLGDSHFVTLYGSYNIWQEVRYTL